MGYLWVNVELIEMGDLVYLMLTMVLATFGAANPIVLILSILSESSMGLSPEALNVLLDRRVLEKGRNLNRYLLRLGRLKFLLGAIVGSFVQESVARIGKWRMKAAKKF